MGYDMYFYGLILIALAIYGVNYLYKNLLCKKWCGFRSEVRSHFEINAGAPHAFVQVRYCCHCDEPIVEVARVEINEIKDNRGKSDDDLPLMFQHRGSHRGVFIDG